MRSIAMLFAFACFVVASPALAQDEVAPSDGVTPPVAAPAPAPASVAAPAPSDPDKKKDEPRDHSAYISISPFHLLLPVVELTGEFRLHERMGLAAIAGYGSIDPNARGAVVKMPRFSVWELGGQFVGYPVGHFDHGMQLGAEVLYVGVAGATGEGQPRVTGTGQGLAMGPFVGYKFTAPIGFSFNIQGGVQYVTARAEAQSSTEAAAASKNAVIPLLNLNIGWAF